MIQAKVLWASTSDLPAGWPLLSHAHSFYHLFYLRSGTAEFLLDGIAYTVEAGECIIMSPGVVHEVPAETHSLLDSFEVKFTLEDNAIKDFLIHKGPIFSGNTAYLEQLLQNIIFSWTISNPTSQDNANIFLVSLLLSLETELISSEAQVSTYIDTAAYSDLTKRIISYIEKTHTESFSLEQLAGTLGYNKRYLCSVFRHNTGITILEYLNHVRMRHAATCFYYYDVPIAVIAQHIGFITPVHFTRVFKKAVGISPSLFRSCYCLRNIDASENDRLATPHLSVYEQLLGEKILPLKESMHALLELGRIAQEKASRRHN